MEERCYTPIPIKRIKKNKKKKYFERNSSLTLHVSERGFRRALKMEEEQGKKKTLLLHMFSHGKEKAYRRRRWAREIRVSSERKWERKWREKTEGPERREEVGEWAGAVDVHTDYSTGGEPVLRGSGSEKLKSP